MTFHGFIEVEMLWERATVLVTAQHIRTGFFFSHSHKARLIRAGSHLLIKKLYSLSFHMCSFHLVFQLALSHSVQHQPTQQSPVRVERTGLLLRTKGEKRKRHPPSNTVYEERPLFDDIAFTLGTEWNDTVIGGTVLPPKELGRVGWTAGVSRRCIKHKKTKMIQSTADWSHYSKLGPYYRGWGGRDTRACL